jgi:hypothetical protein
VTARDDFRILAALTTRAGTLAVRDLRRLPQEARRALDELDELRADRAKLAELRVELEHIRRVVREVAQELDPVIARLEGTPARTATNVLDKLRRLPGPLSDGDSPDA